MGSLTLAMFVTLDGFTETPEGDMIGPDWSDDLRHHWAGVNARDGHMLLYGRASFEFNAAFWPAMAEKAPDADFRAFAEVMNRLPKAVVSSTLSDAGWNANVLRGPLDTSLATLKSSFSGEIVAVGGMKLARGLLSSPELDELRLLLLPRIAARGRSIFDENGLDRRFTLMSNQSLDTGAVVLSYQTQH
jgi:dihydrofolate reductase